MSPTSPMDDTGFLAKTPLLLKSQDYAWLRSQGLAYIEKLAHELWTDYNIHDPGVTLLELLCYGITDLGYRTAYPVRDLLTGRSAGVPEIALAKSQFHTAREVLPGSPVTFDDMRKVLLDIPGVRNAWIRKYDGVKYWLDTLHAGLSHAKPRHAREIGPIQGLLDVYVECEAADREGRARVEDQIRERLMAHRNLCEDLVNIRDLGREEIAVCAEIDVRPSADVEALLAEMFYRIENYVSPPVRFHTLAEMLARGKPVEEIFEGPRLAHGFIDEDEFEQMKVRCELRVSDIFNLLLGKDIPDALAIRRLSLLSFVDGKLRKQADWLLPLAVAEHRAPVASLDRSKVVFYKNNLPFFPNRQRVAELLKKKRATEGRSALSAKDLDFAIAPGEWRGVAEYAPLQNDLPANYAVGQMRLPASETPLRKAQSKQLKAYLLFYEQLLANYLAQLSRVGELFSWQEGLASTYFTQRVTGLPDLDEIYEPSGSELDDKLAEIIEGSDTASERRSRFLDHVAARFCEDFTEYSLLMFSMYKDDRQAYDHAIAAKRALLADYPELSADRGTGCDHRQSFLNRAVSGFQRRVYRLLGITNMMRRSFAQGPFTIVESNGSWRFQVKDKDLGVVFTSEAGENRSQIEALLDFALGIGGDPDNYRAAEKGNGFELVRHCPRKEDAVVGSTPSEKAKAAAIAAFKAWADPEGFHLIEHILMRPRTNTDPFLPVQLRAAGQCECPEMTDPYSFRASVVLPSWPQRFRDLRFRRFVEDTLRREAPAHILLRICWISYDQMNGFETAYQAWADAAVEDRSAALASLIEVMRKLVTVFPVARLHDCTGLSGDEPQVTLNNSNLGTF